MRVLYVDNSFTFGGAINALAHLLTALDARRVEPIVLSAQDSSTLARLFPGVEVHHWQVKLPWIHDRWHRRITSMPGLKRTPLRWLWNKLRAAWWLAFYHVPAALKLAAFMRRHHIELVHLNNGVSSLVAPLIAARLMRLPVIAHARAHAPQKTGRILQYYAELVDEWIAVSESVAVSLRMAGTDPQRVWTIHDAIDLSAFSPGSAPSLIRSELGVDDDTPVFGLFGRIIPWKGTKEFVLAAHRVLQEMPQARALVVGDRSDGAGDYFDSVVDLAHSLGLEGKLLFTGFREDVADVMRACDIVVHTSVIPEPFGMTVIEGMATGKPVVAANSGGPTEIVEHGDSGYLVDPKNAEALSVTICHLLSHPEEAARIGAKAAVRVQKHFSAERYAREIEAVYDHVAGGASEP